MQTNADHHDMHNEILAQQDQAPLRTVPAANACFGGAACNAVQEVTLLTAAVCSRILALLALVMSYCHGGIMQLQDIISFGDAPAGDSSYSLSSSMQISCHACIV